MTPITSVNVGDLWYGDHHKNHGRIIRIAGISTSPDEPFDPYLSIEIIEDPNKPEDAGKNRYSRASWLQTSYRPTP